MVASTRVAPSDAIARDSPDQVQSGGDRSVMLAYIVEQAARVGVVVHRTMRTIACVTLLCASIEQRPVRTIACVTLLCASIEFLHK